jgi:hypothetical protein
MGKLRNVYEDFVGKPKRKRPAERLRCRWEDNIKMYLNEIGWYGVDWVPLAEVMDQ